MHHVPSKYQEYESLQRRVAELERELNESALDESWRSKLGFYPAYAATTGFLLGGLAATVALLVNIAGAALVGRHPLELIRVYLTFPLGEQALALTTVPRGPAAIDERMILLMGVCLYLGTGMLIGSVFQLILSAFPRPWPQRVLLAGAIALVVWIINFYGILSWLQPLVCGGNWIVDSRIHPIWVAAGTHLVFGCTMGLLSPLGDFPRGPQSVEKS